jgi:hypothetical protein
MKSKTLFLYAVDFPSGAAEPYLINEMPTLSAYFHKVVVITSLKKHKDVPLPSNVSVLPIDDVKATNGKKALLLKNFFLILGILAGEFKECKNKPFFFSRFRLTLSEILHALSLAERINVLISKEDRPIIHYSFWMNEFALALAILKEKKARCNVCFQGSWLRFV